MFSESFREVATEALESDVLLHSLQVADQPLIRRSSSVNAAPPGPSKLGPTPTEPPPEGVPATSPVNHAGALPTQEFS